MQEFYEGYVIRIRWNHKSMGYDFCIYNAANMEVSHSEISYFYEKNALDSAKENVRAILKNTNSK